MEFCSVFLAVPLILLWMAFNQLGEYRRDNLLRSGFRRIDDCLSLVKAFSKTPEVLGGLFRSVAERASSAKDPLARFARDRNMIRKRFPGLFDFVFLDGEGKLVPGLSDVKPLPELVRGFSDDVGAYALGFPSLISRNFPVYRSWIGPLLGTGWDSSLLDVVMPVGYRKSRGMAFISSPHRWGMFVVLISPPPDWEILGSRLFLSLIRRVFPDLRMALVRDVRGVPSAPAALGPAGISLDRALAEMRDALEGRTREGRHLWGRTPITRDHSAVVALADRAGAEHLLYSRRIIALVCSIFLFGAVLSRWVFFNPAADPVSFRAKLVALFLFAVGVPLGLLGISAHSYLQERRVVLSESLFSDLEKSLREFDGRFTQTLGEFEASLKRVLDRPPASGSPLLYSACGKMASIESRTAPLICELFAEGGARVFQSRTQWGTFIRRFLPVIQFRTEWLMAWINGEPPPKETAKDQVVGNTVEFLGFEPEKIVLSTIETLGTVQPMLFSSQEFFSLLAPVRDSMHRCRFLAFLVWPAEFIQEWVFRRQLVRTRRVDSPIRLGRLRISRTPVAQDGGLLAPEKNHVAFPRPRFDSRDMVRARSFPWRFRCRKGERVVFATALRGGHFTGFDLLAWADDSGIEAELADFRMRAIAFGLGFLVSCLLAGNFLAGNILDAVKSLSDGFFALRNRRFSERVQVLGNDEFAELATSFNKMLSGMEDLEIARILQEDLFPAEPLQTNGWEVFGTTVSASRVGGDYFDYFPARENSIALFMGDVSGHGASAAMVVALAKALICQPQRERSPVQVLEMMQEVMGGILDQLKLMTFFVGKFDCISGKLVYSNAGQPFPFLVRNGKAAQKGIPGFPLGTRSRIPYKVGEIVLEEGDVLVLFSDGIPEARTADRKLLGYPAFGEVLPRLIGETPTETERNIRQWHARVAPADPPEDDVSLLILQKVRR